MESLFPEHSDLPTFLDAIPSPVLLTDGDVRVLEANRAARELLDGALQHPAGPRGGDAMHCIFARDADDGCGTGDCCPACVLRKSVTAAAQGRPAPRRVAHMILETAGRAEDRWFHVGATPVALAGRDLVMLVLDDVTQLVELRQLAPFCPGCGEVRELTKLPSQARHFVHRHPDFLLAQELCRDCRDKSPDEFEAEGEPGSTD